MRGAGTAFDDVALDDLQRIGNLRPGHAGQPQSLESAREHRLDPHAIPGRDAQYRRDARIEVTPMHMGGGQREFVHARLLCARHRENQQKNRQRLTHR